MFDRQPPSGSTSAADAGTTPAERVMRIGPLDLRQHLRERGSHDLGRCTVEPGGYVN